MAHTHTAPNPSAYPVPGCPGCAEGGSYVVKCDECKVDMRRTDSLRESAAGGVCAKCRAERHATIAMGQIKAMRLAAVKSIGIGWDASIKKCSVVVTMRAGRAYRIARVTYRRDQDDYSLTISTARSRVGVPKVEEIEHAYIQDVADYLTADGFDGRIA